MSLIDRLNEEFETIGKRAQAALDEGRHQLELLRHKRKQDNAARDLGLLLHARERGREVDQRKIDGLLAKLDELEESITRLERELAAERCEDVSVGEEPAPASATTAEAEVVTAEDGEAPPA